MAIDPKEKARAEVLKAQAAFERDAEAVREARRRAFTQAQKEGLSLREISEEVGLHRSRINQQLSGL